MPTLCLHCSDDLVYESNATELSIKRTMLSSFSPGQQVVEEILDAQRPGCPREFFNIKVDPDVTPHFDPDRKGNIEMPVIRSRYDQRTGYSPNNPRQQVGMFAPKTTDVSVLTNTSFFFVLSCS